MLYFYIQGFSVNNIIYNICLRYGGFTVLDTETETDTNAFKSAQNPMVICVGIWFGVGQCEHTTELF